MERGRLCAVREGTVISRPPRRLLPTRSSSRARPAAELEGVFLARDRLAEFTPVKVGIAGERYFESLEGLKEGDVVITGPFESVRQLEDGNRVRIETPAR